MKTLVTAHVVQFSLWEYETFQIRAGGTGVIGPNGAGKTSLVDAVQIAMVGGHGQHLHFNAQSVHKDSRSIRAYALGTMRSGEGGSDVISRKRDEALSYITLVFQGEDEHDVVSAGICLHATVQDCRVLGLYVLPGVALKLQDHLEDLGDRGKAPIEWELFQANARREARAAGAEATITPHPEAYIRELLHNIQQGVDMRKFLRAFGHSINLKAVSSVGDFLRGYLVEATPIDKRGTLQHIKTLRRLGQQIEDVKTQVGRLEDIERRYGKLARLHRESAVAKAVKLTLQREQADEDVATLDGEVKGLEEQLAQARRDLPHLEEQHRGRNQAYELVLAELLADPEAQQQQPQLRSAQQRIIDGARKDVDRLALQLRDALQEIVVVLEGRGVELTRDLAKAEMARWDGWAKAGRIATEDDLSRALGALRDCAPVLERLWTTAQDAERRAKEAARSAAATLRAMGEGKRITDPDVAHAVDLFDQAEIGYQTVASLVRVTDAAWQGAIETFLGPNRLALVVDAGREDDAVQLIRREQISGVKVVQPEHLREDIGRTPEAGTVGALIEGSDPVALGYLRRILGRMKCVESAAQLRKEPRALTVDYMLSASGGTTRMRPLDQSRWMLGVKLTSADRAEADQGDRRAKRELQEAEGRLRQLGAAAAQVNTALQQVTPVAYATVVERHAADRAELDTALQTANLPVSDRLKALKEKVDQARGASVAAGEKAGEHSNQIATMAAQLENKRPALEQKRSALMELEKALTAATHDQDCDHELVATEYERLSLLVAKEGLQAALAELDQSQEQRAQQIQRAGADAQNGFLEFINEASIGLVDERADWRKAHSWIKGHIRKLRDSTLMEYAQQAADARKAAEDAFQADVKFKMHEAIQRVRLEIRDLNGILQTCPAFTNGEKYQFVATVSPTHKALYDLIMTTPEAGNVDLFNQQEVQKNLMSLLEASESGADKGNNPLEDYRLLFNFDLQILQDGKMVDVLSKRMGVASNGEHRVPFYVIAGAALATAYRIRPGAKRIGAGLMILDEAFYGMDAQNTYVTAKFLQSLGLQLLMAGPDSDVGKLTPLMDNYYDLARYGSDVFCEHVELKEAARRLFESDIPLLQPQLIEAEVERLATAGAAK